MSDMEKKCPSLSAVDTCQADRRLLQAKIEQGQEELKECNARSCLTDTLTTTSEEDRCPDLVSKISALTNKISYLMRQLKEVGNPE